ncbi:uncharacterized protein V1513DRAFT_275926 [Lipomyces chichibuensis]|uniref:uncharacterized protein n=1 Tax=Lipomyces chichibuensis TaxID=1546026 RepID=UPI003342E825
MQALRRRQRATKHQAISQSQTQQSNTSSQVEDASIAADANNSGPSGQQNVPALPQNSIKRTSIVPGTQSPDYRAVDGKKDAGLAPPPFSPLVRRSPRLRNSPGSQSSVARQRSRREQRSLHDDANATITMRTLNTTKEDQIHQLRLELAERRETLRNNYAAAAKSLRVRLEMRIHRIPRHLRQMTLGELRNIQVSNQTSSPHREIPVV